MKKIIRNLFLSLALMVSVFGLVACQDNNSDAKSEGTLTHEEYMATEIGEEVTIEAYIQGKQSWWSNKATLYLQDNDGGYFVYELTCTEEEYNTDLAIGNKIKVTGVKGEWAGEIEIMGQEAGAEATWELLKGNKIYEPKDVTLHLGKDSLADFQNMVISLKNLTVVAQADGTSAFYYNYDGSGSQGDDIYVSFTDGTNTITCCLEKYLTGSNTEVYKTAEALKVGDKVNIEGFLYWYEGAQPHVTSIEVK